MKSVLALALALLPVAAAAAPVHVALRSSASVAPDADGFFSLASVADLKAGDVTLRARLAKVPVGRAPLSGDVRHLTQGDLALKLRQAGFQPGRDAVLEGAATADVTAGSAAPSTPNTGASAGAGLVCQTPASSSSAGVPPTLLVHRGDPVTIRIDDGGLSITAKGVARDNGTAGDTIRVYREGTANDLSVTVTDTDTVELEP